MSTNLRAQIAGALLEQLPTESLWVLGELTVLYPKIRFSYGPGGLSVFAAEKDLDKLPTVLRYHACYIESALGNGRVRIIKDRSPEVIPTWFERLLAEDVI
jgi:hypothetical protein